MARKKLLVANWKLNHNRKSARAFFDNVVPSMNLFSAIDTAIAPVAPMLDFVSQMLVGKNIMLAAQNVFYAEKGAFTGEWSAEHLAELGVAYCIVGHSERRKLFFETDDDVLKKAQSCLRSRIIPVICVGESFLEREQKHTNDVIKKQILTVISGLVEPFTELSFAYEPIWAIGTGKTATCTQIQEIHQLIRMLLSEVFGKTKAYNFRILYGGSVTAENIREIVSMPDVDGALVGGASLQAASFLSMFETLHDV
jgi:triosephosphate isomerase